MCICILKTKDGYISEERLKQAYNANPDGWGILFSYIPFEKQIELIKGIEDFNFFYNQYYCSKLVNGEIIVHFRTASSCGMGYEYCHPHIVNKNLAFVHNGNLFEFNSYFKNRKKDNLTDTQRFNDEILKKLPENFLEDENIYNILNEYCKINMSKMIFMNNKGKWNDLYQNW